MSSRCVPSLSIRTLYSQAYAPHRILALSSCTFSHHAEPGPAHNSSRRLRCDSLRSHVGSMSVKNCLKNYSSIEFRNHHYHHHRHHHHCQHHRLNVINNKDTSCPKLNRRKPVCTNIDLFGVLDVHHSVTADSPTIALKLHSLHSFLPLCTGAEVLRLSRPSTATPSGFACHRTCSISRGGSRERSANKPRTCPIGGGGGDGSSCFRFREHRGGGRACTFVRGEGGSGVGSQGSDRRQSERVPTVGDEVG